MFSHDQILDLIRTKVHHPATARDLAQLLRIPREERQGFKRQLKALASNGLLVLTRGNRFGLPDTMDLIPGRLQAHPGGFGFVVPDVEPSSDTSPTRRSPSAREDIYVSAANLGDAMHGDRVLVRVERRSERGLEGRIIRVVDRAQARVV